MDTAMKISAIAVTAALCAVVVKKQAPEIGIVLSLAAGAVILGLSLVSMGRVRSLMDTLADTAGLSPAVLLPVIKTAGIAIITRIAAEVCRDAKESGVAAFVETAGAALALVVALPLLEAVLRTITGLL